MKIYFLIIKKRNRFIFTSLIFAQLLISIHSKIANEKAYAYNKFASGIFQPIVFGHEVTDDDMKKSLGFPLINLVDTSSK